MVSIEQVKNHIEDYELDGLIDNRFSKRFVDFLPSNEWKNFGYKYTGKEEYTPKEWTENNILEQLEEDVHFGYQKAVDERGISSELMAKVVIGWCKVLENGLDSERDAGPYYINLFVKVANYYGWKL